MQLPFTTAQFFGVVATYNEAVWPAQVALGVLALLAVAGGIGAWRQADVLVSGVLTFLWAWLGFAYHFAFFSAINPLAWIFGGISLAGGAMFAWHGVFGRRLHFRVHSGVRAASGSVMILFALFGYPLWAHLAGHRYPAFPTFGLPCPTTLFTVGMLTLLEAPYPRSVCVVPLLWCLVGAQAAFLLSVPQDLGLLVAAALCIVLLMHSRNPRPEA